MTDNLPGYAVPMFAVLRDRHGEIIDQVALTDNDPLELDFWREYFENRIDMTLESARIPDGCEDFSITLTEDPDGIRCWAAHNYSARAV
jgi:hypothetical protein